MLAAMSDETELRAAVRHARAAYDTARAELFTAIQAAIAGGVGPNALARDSAFSREYIARIRDGKGPRDVRP